MNFSNTNKSSSNPYNERAEFRLQNLTSIDVTRILTSNKGDHRNE